MRQGRSFAKLQHCDLACLYVVWRKHRHRSIVHPSNSGGSDADSDSSGRRAGWPYDAIGCFGTDLHSTTSVIGVAAGSFAGATELDADYHKQFVRCDGLLPGAAGKDTFRGYSMKRPNKPDSQQYYLCSRDPSRVEALLKLTDGAVYWESKMALDVDGAWAAWNGIPGATDLKMTSYRWRNITNKKSQAAQFEPDVYPFIVMPTAGIKELTGSAAGEGGGSRVRRADRAQDGQHGDRDLSR